MDLKKTKGTCDFILLIKTKVMKTGTEGGAIKNTLFPPLAQSFIRYRHKHSLSSADKKHSPKEIISNAIIAGVYFALVQ